MTPKIVGSIEELLAALRQRRDELKISNETLDAISGLSDRHTSKLLAANFPSRNLGKTSFPLILGALGLGIAKVEIVEDPEAVAAVQDRWQRWKRPPYGSPRIRLSAAALECAKGPILQANCRAANQVRNSVLTCEQRSKLARHAAKCRWRKRRKTIA